MQPVGKVDFHSIVTEGSPTFVRVVALVQNVIRIADTLYLVHVAVLDLML